MVVMTAVQHRSKVDETTQYFTISMPSVLFSLQEKGQLYRLKDERLGDWAEVTKYQMGFLPWLEKPF